MSVKHRRVLCNVVSYLYNFYTLRHVTLFESQARFVVERLYTSNTATTFLRTTGRQDMRCCECNKARVSSKATVSSTPITSTLPFTSATFRIIAASAVGTKSLVQKIYHLSTPF